MSKMQQMLNKKEESFLIIEWKYGRIKKSRNKLVAAYMPLITNFARKFANRGKHSLDDLRNEAAIGFMKAVDKFRFNKKSRISSFAVHDMKYACSVYARNNHCQMRLGTNISDKKALNGLKRVMNEILARKGTFTITEEDRQEAADRLGISIHIVHRMEPRIYTRDVSLDGTANTSDQDDNGEQTRIKELSSVTASNDFNNVEKNIDQRHIFTVIKKIIDTEFSERDKNIITMRMIGEMTPDKFEFLQNTYNISKERIRQILRSSFTIFKNHLQNIGIENLSMISI